MIITNITIDLTIDALLIVSRRYLFDSTSGHVNVLTLGSSMRKGCLEEATRASEGETSAMTCDFKEARAEYQFKLDFLPYSSLEQQYSSNSLQTGLKVWRNTKLI